MQVKSAPTMGWTNRSAAASLLLAMEQHRQQVGARVLALRDARGWSQPDLAYRAGVDAKTISRIENGKHDSRRGTIRAIAEALGVTELDILGPPPDVLGLKQVATDDQLDGVSAAFSVRVDNVEAQLNRIENLLTENNTALHRLMHLVDQGLFTPREDGGSRHDQIGLGAALAQAFQTQPELVAALREQLLPPRDTARTGRAPSKRRATG